MMRPTKVFLPAIFLFVLGLGNIAVGSLKQSQYEQVLADLSTRIPDIKLMNASPLKRVQLARQTADRNFDRLQQARARRDLYQLVIVGGQAMIALGLLLGIVCLFLGILKRPAAL